MRFTHKLRYLLITLMVLSACNLINPEEPIPAYVHIPAIDFVTTNPSQGTAKQQITDAWVFLNDELVGAFPVPSTFPIIASGRKRLTVRPGIILNGIGATRNFNPFFIGLDTQINFVGKQIDTLRITAQYNPDTQFRWSDDFEQQSTDLIRANNSDTTFRIEKALGVPFEGSGCLAFEVDLNRPNIRIESNKRFTRPNNFAAVFWEMHYKNEVPFNIGIVVYTQGGSRFAYPLVRLNASSEWKKVYLNISDGIFQLNAGDSFSLYLTTETVLGPKAGQVLIDNIKLMY